MVRNLLLGIAAILSAGGAQAAIVVNGSFENPTVSNYVYQPAGTGIAFTGGAGITENNTAWNFAAAPDGSMSAFCKTSRRRSST